MIISHWLSFPSTGIVCTPDRYIYIYIGHCMCAKIGSSSSSYSHITGLYCGLGLLLGTLKVIYLFIIVFLLKI